MLEIGTQIWRLQLDLGELSLIVRQRLVLVLMVLVKTQIKWLTRGGNRIVYRMLNSNRR